MLGSSFLFGKEPEGCRQIAIGAHGSAARADCLLRGKPTVSDGKSQLCRRGAPARGLTRRLRRERWGCRPQGDRTFFRSERKYQRKPAARRLREKGFYCPFCRRGSQRRAQWSWTANPIACARSCARLFPPSKWAGLFPFAAYRRSAPAQLAGDILNPCRVGCFGVACVFSQGKRPAGNQIHAGLFSEP